MYTASKNNFGSENIILSYLIGLQSEPNLANFSARDLANQIESGGDELDVVLTAFRLQLQKIKSSKIQVEDVIEWVDELASLKGGLLPISLIDEDLYPSFHNLDKSMKQETILSIVPAMAA